MDLMNDDYQNNLIVAGAAERSEPDVDACGQRWREVTCSRPADHTGEHHAVIEHEGTLPTDVTWGGPTRYDA